ncbi:peroxisomal biogenesis factor 3 [Plakobranchus ocellatus]|uniref:Peroxisomal biogenesis factor 3 n=1 Tax=Plakobranchus ocellatus TaxID=259542 RepID=A0AAV4ACP1_9GAST|nr:peroxisomal biogenesis factor 3 [Plakobranchus ocellatus]
MWAFIKRHRKKFIFLGAFVGGTWVLYKYMWRKIQEIRDEEDKQYLISVRRQHHFDSNQRTCNTTVLAMIPNLRETLVKHLDTESLKELLKSSPPNKLDIWEELKIMSFTRTIAAVYGSCMLSVMLRVQLNIVSGYLYLETVHPPNGLKPESENKSSIAPKVQERYLSLVKVFIEQGFVDFIHYLKLAVMKEVGCLPLKELVSLDNLYGVLSHIRERVECGVDKATQALYPYLLSSERVPDLESVMSPEDLQLEKLVSETRDIFESSDFHTVLKESIDRGFHCILDGLADHYKQQLQGGEASGIHEISIAVAKLIPVVNSQLNRIVGDAPNQFIQELLLMEELKQLAANVYEAFSQDPSEVPSI